MLEVGKTYHITMIELELGEGETITVYANRTVAEINWPLVRLKTVLDEEMVINLSSPHFVKAEPLEE